MADLLDELRKLKQALDEGLLTQAEHDRRKQKLLGEESSGGMPQRIGPYKIAAEIGRGGMGVVYLGRHRTPEFAERQGGDVAIKLLHSQYAEEPAFLERFEREAAVGIKLEHPGIVRVLELVMDGSRVALVMERVDGRPLSEVIGTETGPIPWERAAPLISQLLTAVRHAHAKGVIHRDLKPENVMLTAEGKLKVLDFGIAKDLGSGRTKTGTKMGTVDYMAPEQYLDAKSVDARADVYALGMTLYEMLAGRLPWSAEETEFRVLERKKNGEIPPPTDFYPDIPPDIVAVVMACIAPGIKDRPWDVQTLIDQLKAAIEASKAPPARPKDTARKQNLYSEFQLLMTQARIHFYASKPGVEQKAAKEEIRSLIHRFETEAGFPKHPTDKPSREVNWGYREMEALIADLRIKLKAEMRRAELEEESEEVVERSFRSKMQPWLIGGMAVFLVLGMVVRLDLLDEPERKRQAVEEQKEELLDEKPVEKERLEQCLEMDEGEARDACMESTIVEFFRADPARGEQIISEVDNTQLRDFMWYIVTREVDPGSNQYCLKIETPSLAERCRSMVLRPHLHRELLGGDGTQGAGGEPADGAGGPAQGGGSPPPPQ